MAFLEWKAIVGGVFVLGGLVLQQVGLEPCGIDLSNFGKELIGGGAIVGGAVSMLFAKPPVKK